MGRFVHLQIESEQAVTLRITGAIIWSALRAVEKLREEKKSG